MKKSHLEALMVIYDKLKSGKGMYFMKIYLENDTSLTMDNALKRRIIDDIETMGRCQVSRSYSKDGKFYCSIVSYNNLTISKVENILDSISADIEDYEWNTELGYNLELNDKGITAEIWLQYIPTFKDIIDSCRKYLKTSSFSDIVDDYDDKLCHIFIIETFYPHNPKDASDLEDDLLVFMEDNGFENYVDIRVTSGIFEINNEDIEGVEVELTYLR